MDFFIITVYAINSVILIVQRYGLKLRRMGFSSEVLAKAQKDGV